MSQTSKIAIAVVITALIVGGGVYFWQQQEKSKVDNSKTLSNNSEQSTLDSRKNTETIVNNSEIIESVKLRNYIYNNLSGKTDELLANQEVLLVSKNAQQNNSEGCLKSYWNGEFSLVFRDMRTQSIIDEVKLGNVDLPKNALHINHAVYGESTPGYFVITERYGSCNGNRFSFYAPPRSSYKKIRKAVFSDISSNELFASSLKNIELGGETLVVEYYDNVSGTAKNKVYTWDGDISFRLEER